MKNCNNYSKACAKEKPDGYMPQWNMKQIPNLEYRTPPYHLGKNVYDSHYGSPDGSSNDWIEKRCCMIQNHLILWAIRWFQRQGFLFSREAESSTLFRTWNQKDYQTDIWGISWPIILICLLGNSIIICERSVKLNDKVGCWLLSPVTSSE